MQNSVIISAVEPSCSIRTAERPDRLTVAFRNFATPLIILNLIFIYNMFIYTCERWYGHIALAGVVRVRGGTGTLRYQVLFV
jgi:hypothetical protein